MCSLRKIGRTTGPAVDEPSSVIRNLNSIDEIVVVVTQLSNKPNLTIDIRVRCRGESHIQGSASAIVI
jgi:hypothetical protein